jgi:hypothetical protein
MIWISQTKLVVETIAVLCAHCLALSNSHDSELQAAEMQLFVAATRGAPDDSFLLESGVRRIAGPPVRPWRTPVTRARARWACSQLCSGSLIYEYLESYR